MVGVSFLFCFSQDFFLLVETGRWRNKKEKEKEREGEKGLSPVRLKRKDSALVY